MGLAHCTLIGKQIHALFSTGQPRASSSVVISHSSSHWLLETFIGSLKHLFALGDFHLCSQSNQLEAVFLCRKETQRVR